MYRCVDADIGPNQRPVTNRDWEEKRKFMCDKNSEIQRTGTGVQEVTIRPDIDIITNYDMMTLLDII